MKSIAFIFKVLIPFPAVLIGWLILSFPCFLQAQTHPFNFERFSTEDGLPSNLILDMVQDHNGFIWLAIDDGLVRYDGYQFFHYRSVRVDTTSLSRNQLNAFAEDRDNNLSIGPQEGGLFRYERNSEQFTRFMNDPNNPNNLLEDEVRVLLVDKNNTLWIGTGETFDASIVEVALATFHFLLYFFHQSNRYPCQ